MVLKKSDEEEISDTTKTKNIEKEEAISSSNPSNIGAPLLPQPTQNPSDKGKIEKEKLEKERLEKERLRNELERGRREKERLDNELEREMKERKGLESEWIKKERERLENELERKRKKMEILENELEKERKERERLENELKRERKEMEILENELEKERKERERLENELERERKEKEKLERERLENELERERKEKEKLESELNKEREEKIIKKLLKFSLRKEESEEEISKEISKEEISKEEISKSERLENELERERKEKERLESELNKERKEKIIKKLLKFSLRREESEEEISKEEISEREGLENENLEREKSIFSNNNDEKKENDALINITPEYIIGFENRIKQLRSLDEMYIEDSYVFIEINRNNLFFDMYNSIMNKSPKELKKRLIVVYKGEEGIDGNGGLLRDLLYQMSKLIRDPNYSLFKYAHNDSYELEINPFFSVVEPNYLQYYRFIGRIIGLAILNKQFISIPFILPFYKKLLNKPIEISDLKYVDYELYRNLQHLKNINDVKDLYLTFTLNDKDCFGNIKTIELKPNGANIDVTDDNKNEYINLIAEHKLNCLNDKKQLDALKQGFYEIIPQRINSILDEFDLKYLISGINIIDVDDWENNTEYEGYCRDDITIINFWKCVRSFNNENLKKLLIFATGNSQVPVTGFKDLQAGGIIYHFKIRKSGTVNDLPRSHICFNFIDLPPYVSLTLMRQKLLLAISEGLGPISLA